MPSVPEEPQCRPGEVGPGAEAADVAPKDDEEALGQAEIHLAADDRIDPVRALVEGPGGLRVELELQVGVATAGVRVEGDAAPVGAGRVQDAVLEAELHQPHPVGEIDPGGADVVYPELHEEDVREAAQPP